MKYKNFVIIIIILVISIGYYILNKYAKQEIDINGGFESGIMTPDGWKLVEYNGNVPIWENAIFHDGSKSIKISLQTGVSNIRSGYLESQNITVDPNTYYTLSLYIKTINLSRSSDFIKIRQFDINDSFIKTDLTPDWDQSKDWREKITVVKTDNKTAFIDILIDIENGNGTLYVDDINLSKMNVQLHKWNGPLQCYNNSRDEPIPGLIDHMVIFEGVALKPIERKYLGDGDIVFNVKPLNSFYDNMLTETNFSHEDDILDQKENISADNEVRGIHVEVEPSCQGNIPIPIEGDYVFIVGDYRLDIGHAGWAEMHPVRLILFEKPVKNLNSTNIVFRLPFLNIKVDKPYINLGEGFNVSGNTIPNSKVWLEVRKLEWNSDIPAILQTKSDNDGNFIFSINSTPIINGNIFFSSGRWYVRSVLPEVGSVSQAILIEVKNR